MRKRHLGDSKPPLKHASVVNPAGEWYSDVKYNIIAYMKLFPIFHLLHFIFTMIMPVISHQAIFVRNRFVRRAEKIWNWRKVAQNRLVMFYGVWFCKINCGPNKTFLTQMVHVHLYHSPSSDVHNTLSRAIIDPFSSFYLSYVSKKTWLKQSFGFIQGLVTAFVITTTLQQLSLFVWGASAA